MTSLAQQRLLQAARSSSPMLADRLVAWQRQQGRHHLPWQNTRDPYRVWLSEIMLQQTQVSTVLGYYDRFLKAFPDVAALAAASLDEVLTLWAGLGYYSRARNLHRCAQAVVAHHGGSFPQTAEALMTLPGIGRSTAAAIAGFCFHERTAILDGNVKRVLTRVLGWGEDLSVSANERALWLAAEAVLPEKAKDMPAYTQGVMDLGATLCTQRKPACLTCPWSDICIARREGQPEAFPVKTRKLKRSSRESWWLWLEHDEQVWLVQRPATGVWGGLWTLPLFDSEALMDEAVLKLGAQTPEIQPAIKHVLTHMDWHLHPRRSLLATRPRAADLRHLAGEAVGADAHGVGRWVPVSELDSVGLPAPLRKLLPAG
ncbi:MAG: A/G-specific adenine glycosylase [Aquabacterium sp.]|jgi:A/G-specific adenine glycosylase|uniref:A/G-specific adenine glycosylase n=1 Tax=Aquabacterium sp. TaxID=1872578 RepID=UPI003BAF0867